MMPHINEQTVGTCGLCMGPVTLPVIWHGVIPPVPTCKKCGATAKPNYGPVMPMDPPRRTWVSTNIELDPDLMDQVSTEPRITTSDGTECCAR